MPRTDTRPNNLPWRRGGARLACEAWGKRLCSGDAWRLACAGPTDDPFPYGGTYDDDACNACDPSFGCPIGDVAPVGSLASCEGGYSGIFDMSGNVSEWVDECTLNQTDFSTTCSTVGGSYTGLWQLLACSPQEGHQDEILNAYDYNAVTGFRCCVYLD